MIFFALLLSQSVTAANANVEISQTSKTPVNVGDSCSYTLSAHNLGPDTAHNINVADTAPHDLENVTYTPSGETTYSGGIWHIPQLESDEIATLYISGFASSQMAGKTTTNVATRISQDEDNDQPAVSYGRIYTKKSDIEVYNYVADDIYNWDAYNVPTFVMDIVNNGPNDATDVIGWYKLPNGLKFNTANSRGIGSWSFDESTNTVWWYIGNLPKGGAASLDIFPLTIRSGTFTSTAEAASDMYDSNPDNNIQDMSIYVEKSADIHVKQTASNYVPIHNENVYLHITATNNGPDTAHNIKINDFLPSGLSLISADTHDIGTFSGGIWTIPTLTNGASATLDLLVKVTGTGTIVNTASKELNSPDEFDWNFNNNAQKVYLNPKTSDLEVYNYVADDIYNWDAYNVPTFVMDIVNNGPNDATDVVGQYVLPEGLLFDIADVRGTGSWTYNARTRTITWNVGSMPSGGAASLDIFPLILNSGILTSVAKITHSDQYDPDTDNNVQNMSIYVEKSADIQVTQTASNYNPLHNEIITLHITALNNGPDDAHQIKINDVLPSRLTLLNVDIHGIGTYYGGVWTIPELLNGTSATLDLQVRVNGAAPIMNTASKDQNTPDEPDWNYNNNAQTVYLNSGGYTKTKDVNTYNYNADDISNWDVYNTPVMVMDIVNEGSDDVENVIGKYILPEGMTFLSADTRGSGTWTYDPDTRTITWDLGFMPSGGGASMDIIVLIEKTGTLTTQAIVNETTSYATFIVDKSADIQVNQTSSNYNPNLNDNIHLHITVNNNGPDTAHNIKINDFLPAGLTLISVDTHGIGTFSDGVWTIPTLANGTSVILDLLVKVTSTGTITNIASKDQNTPDEFDWNYNNNAQEVILNGYVKDYNVKTYNYNADDISNWDVYNTPVMVMDIVNEGSDDVENVIGKYILPEGMTFLSADTRGTGTWTYDPDTRTITWNVGFMPSGAAASMDIIVLIEKTGTLTTQAIVNETTSYATIVVDKSADIQVNQFIDNPNPMLGDLVTIYVYAANNGPDDAHNIKINDVLPSGLTFVSANPITGTFEDGVWTIPTLLNGESTILEISALVESLDTMVNIVEKDPATPDEFDWNYSNNAAELIIPQRGGVS